MFYRTAILVLLGLLPAFGTAIALEIIGKNATGSITLGTPDLPGSFSGPEKKRVFEKFISSDRINKFSKLEVIFKVIKASRCPITYEPTKIYLNAELLGKINFRPLNVGAKVIKEIPITPGLFKAGKNHFKIVSGVCDFSFDKMKFTKVKIK